MRLTIKTTIKTKNESKRYVSVKSHSKSNLNNDVYKHFFSLTSQVELISRGLEGKVELKYTVTLGEDVLTSELTVCNNKQTSLELKGYILSHLTLSSPEATFAIGLEGSNFHSIPPFSSNHAIIPPDCSSGLTQRLQGIVSGWGKSSQRESGEEIEGEEMDNYKQLVDKISRIYTSAPRNFTIIDRVRTFFFYNNLCWVGSQLLRFSSFFITKLLNCLVWFFELFLV